MSKLDKLRNLYFYFFEKSTKLTAPPCPPGSSATKTTSASPCYGCDSVCWGCVAGKYQDQTGQSSCKITSIIAKFGGATIAGTPAASMVIAVVVALILIGVV